MTNIGERCYLLVTPPVEKECHLLIAFPKKFADYLHYNRYCVKVFQNTGGIFCTCFVHRGGRVLTNCQTFTQIVSVLHIIILLTLSLAGPGLQMSFHFIISFCFYYWLWFSVLCLGGNCVVFSLDLAGSNSSFWCREF